MDNQQNTHDGNRNQQQMISEVTRLLCQAQAVQIRNLQASLPDTIQQTTKALDDGQPEVASSLWKQVVQNAQTISHLFNQTNDIMYPQRGRSSGRGQYSGSCVR